MRAVVQRVTSASVTVENETVGSIGAGMMVLIGVAFMMGLFSTKSIMKESVDAFNDEYSLQDVQLYSSYGFDDDDVKEIKKQPVVDKVQSGCPPDALGSINSRI